MNKIILVINMLTASYEQAYISAFAKIFSVLKHDYEVYVKSGQCNNYEIEIKNINNKDIDDYLSICFQKQNGSLIVISHKNNKEDLIKKLLNDISIALNTNPMASYTFKEKQDYKIYHYEYIKENIIVDNKEIIKTLIKNDEIANINWNIISNKFIP